MHHKTFVLLFKCIILYSEYFSGGKALLGNGIRQATSNEFPAVVCISQYDPGETLVDNTLCTGTLISRTLVITAEHCFRFTNQYQLEVVIGNSELTRGVLYYPVWWISYDQWLGALHRQAISQFNDIALLKLFGLIPEVTPAVLSILTPQHLFYGLDVQVFGAARTENQYNPMIVHTSTTKVVPNADCENMVQVIAQVSIPIPHNIICTYRQPYLQLGDGDSGGPLTYFGLLIAVNAGVSPPTENAFHEGKVNIHIGIDYYRDFLRSIMDTLY